MDINEFKLKVETILNKHFILKDLGNGNYKLIEDKEKDPIELYVGNAFGELSVKTKNNNIMPFNEFIQKINLLKDKDITNEELRNIYVVCLGYDKRLKGNWGSRVTLAIENKYLDILVNDEDADVRKAVAEQGYKLDKLINDKVNYVRAAVARQGYGLNILINDEDDYTIECTNKWLKEHNLTIEEYINNKKYTTSK